MAGPPPEDPRDEIDPELSARRWYDGGGGGTASFDFELYLEENSFSGEVESPLDVRPLVPDHPAVPWAVR
jgi:hypothetical protein